MDWNDLIRNLLKSEGAQYVEKLQGALDGLAEEAKEPWKKIVINLVADALEEYGPEGMSKVEQVLAELVAGSKPSIYFASLKTRSDFLASLQNAEAHRKTAARDFFYSLGHTIGLILRGILKGLT